MTEPIENQTRTRARLCDLVSRKQYVHILDGIIFAGVV